MLVERENDKGEKKEELEDGEDGFFGDFRNISGPKPTSPDGLTDIPTTFFAQDTSSLFLSSSEQLSLYSGA